ncbi:MAG: hypothetical protein ABH834_00300 [Candidatus Altiarchaeota archaeon]
MAARKVGKKESDVVKVEDVLKESFELYKKNFISLVIAGVIVAVGSVFIITAPPLLFGLHFMALKAIRHEQVEIKDVFRGFDYLFKSWVMFIAGFTSVVIGLFFFLLPGLALLILFNYTIPIAILEGRGGIASLKKSMRVGRDNLQFTIILWILLAILHSIAGSVSGAILLTYPFAVLATCIAAIKLTGDKNKSST